MSSAIQLRPSPVSSLRSRSDVVRGALRHLFSDLIATSVAIRTKARTRIARLRLERERRALLRDIDQLIAHAP